MIKKLTQTAEKGKKKSKRIISERVAAITCSDLCATYCGSGGLERKTSGAQTGQQTLCEAP
jgi:hypothetical protein